MSTSGPTVGRTPKGGRSATRLLEAATTVLARDGIGGATLGRIADEAGMDKRSVVYYFGSREALLVRVVQVVGERIAERIQPGRERGSDLVALVDQNIDALWSAITSAPELARAYFALIGGGTETGEVKRALRALKDVYLGVARDQIAAIEAAGWQARSSSNASALLLVATLRGLLLEWTESGDSPALDQALEQLKASFVDYFAPAQEA